jgi:L-ascorbate metabolism protein UlaG (beta-lactamase superfamily)
MLRHLSFIVGMIVVLFTFLGEGLAQDRPPVSQCQMIAGTMPDAQYARLDGSSLPLVNAAANEDVTITFLGHSTFLIETPDGKRIATDWSGSLRSPLVPDVVTMNKAHSSHYTLLPDPAIPHVLHGWSDTPGEAADIKMVAGDAYIRNVPTDIRGFYGGGAEPNGNSIFIFEVSGLCIGHLGHLHYELTDSHYAEIGRLDVVMVPVDGGLTMGADSMSRVITRLRSSLILPMHRTGPPVSRFLTLFGADFDKMASTSNSIRVSMRTLPKKPMILVLRGM